MAQQRKRTAGDDLRDFKAGKISGNFYHNGIDRSDNYIQHTSAPRYITDKNGKTQVASYNEWIQQEVFQHQHELANGTSSASSNNKTATNDTSVKNSNNTSSSTSSDIKSFLNGNLNKANSSAEDFRAAIKNPNKSLNDRVKGLTHMYNAAVATGDTKTAEKMQKEYDELADRVNKQTEINRHNAKEYARSQSLKGMTEERKALVDERNKYALDNGLVTSTGIDTRKKDRYKVYSEYNSKIDELDKQIAEKQRNGEYDLSDSQKAVLADIGNKANKLTESFENKYKNSTLEQRLNARLHATTSELNWLNKHMYDNATSEELEKYNRELSKEYENLYDRGTTGTDENKEARRRNIEDEQDKIDTYINRAKLSEQKKREYDDIVDKNVILKTVMQKYYALQHYDDTKHMLASTGHDTDSIKNQVTLDDYNYINKLSDKERTQIEKNFKNLKKKGYDTESLYKWYERERDAEKAAETTRISTEYADEHPILGSIASVGARLGGAVPDAIKYISTDIDKKYNGGDGYINPEATNTAISDAMRAKVSENINNDFGSFLYNTGMSMADFASLLPLNAVPGGQALSLGIMGTSAGVGAANDVINNGGTIDNAVKTGIAAGIAETLFEKVSLEQLSAFKASGKSTFRAAVGNVLKGAFTEGSEEAFTDLANRLTDDAINKDLSSYNIAKKNYMEQGMSEAEAENAASWDFWKNVGLDFAGGAISGGVLNFATAGINLAGAKIDMAQNKESNIQIGKAVMADENFDLDLLIRQGLATDKNDRAYNYAQKMQKLVETKGEGKISAGDVGNLMYLINREVGKNPELVNKIAQVKKQNTQEQSNQPVNAQNEQNTAQNGQQNAEQAQASTAINATKKADTEDIGKMYGAYAFGKKHPNGIIATDTSTGKVVKVALKSLESSAKINRSDEENTLVFNTNDGKQVNADSITFSDSQLDTIVHSANEFDTYGARNYISNFEEWRESPQAQKMTDDEMLYKYNRAYSAAYSFGREGVKLDSLKETSEYKILTNILGEQIVSQALSTGRRDVDINTQHHANRLTELINRNGRADTSDVGVYADSGTEVSHIPQELINTLGNLATKTGRNIIISDRLADGVNGVARDGNIILSSEISSQKILATALHEAGHMIKKTNPTEWRTLSDFVSDYLVRKGVDLNKMIDRTIERYGNRLQADEHENTRDAALEEIVCDTLMSIASDEKALNIALRTKQNKSKIAAAIKSLIAKVKDWLIGKSQNYGAKAFAKDLEALEKLAQRFSEAADTARENITEQTEVKNGEKIDIEKFSLDEEDKDLVATHNIRSQNLMNLINDFDGAGLPVPSIAIEKAENLHDNFGDVTLLFNKDTIDPEADSRNKVYNRDAWTSTFPEVEVKIKDEELQKISERVHLSEGYLKSNMFNTSNKERIKKNFFNDLNVRKAFLKEQNIEVTPVAYDKEPRFQMFTDIGVKKFLRKNNCSFDKLVNDIDFRNKLLNDYYDSYTIKSLANKNIQRVNKILDNCAKSKETYNSYKTEFEYAIEYAKGNVQKEINNSSYNDGVVNAIKEHKEEFEKYIEQILSEDVFGEKYIVRDDVDPYDDEGNLKSFDETHYIYNIDNVVKAMKIGASSVGDPFTGGVNYTSTFSTQEFGSIDEIHKNKGNIKELSEEEQSENQQKIIEILTPVIDEVSNSGSYNNDFLIASDNIVDAFKQSKTKNGVYNYLKQYYPALKKSTVDKLFKVRDEIANMPTRYFEAKPHRAVGFNEVMAAVIPADADESLKKALKRMNIPLYEYADESQRADAARKAINTEYTDKTGVIHDSLKFSIDDEYDDLFDFSGNDEQHIDFDKAIDKNNPELTIEQIYHHSARNVKEGLLAGKGIKPEQKKIYNMVKSVMRSYHINPNAETDSLVTEYVDALNTFIDAVQNDKSNFTDAFENFVLKCRDTLRYSTQLDEQHEAWAKEIRDELRGTTLLIPENAIDTIKENYGSVGKYKKALFGKINVKLEHNAKGINGNAVGSYIEDIGSHLENIGGRSLMIEDGFEWDSDSGYRMLDHIMNYVLAPQYVATYDGKFQSESTIDAAAIQMAFDTTAEYLKQQGKAAVMQNNIDKRKLRDINKALRQAEKAKTALNQKTIENYKTDIAEQKAKYNEQREKYRQAYNALKDKKSEEAKRYRDKIHELEELNAKQRAVINTRKKVIADEYRAERDKTKYRQKINTTLERLINRHLKPKPSNNVPISVVKPLYRLLSELTGNYSGFSKGVNDITEVTLSAETEKLISALNSEIANTDGKITLPPAMRNALLGYNVFDNNGNIKQHFTGLLEDVRNIFEKAEENGKTSLKDFSLSELKRISTAFSEVKKLLDTANKIVINGKEYDAYLVSRKGAEELKKVTGTHKKGSNTQASTAKRTLLAYRKYMSDPIRFARMISGYHNDSVIVQMMEMLNQGQSEAEQLSIDWTNKFEEQMSRFSYKAKKDYVREQAMKFDGIDPNTKRALIDKKTGEQVKVGLTADMLVEMLLEYEDEYGRAHMMYSGYQVPNIKYIKRKNQQLMYSKDSGCYILPTESDISRIRDYVMNNEIAKTVYEICREMYNEDMQNAVNKVSNEKYGYEIAKVKNYCPITIDEDTVYGTFADVLINRSINSRAFLHERENFKYNRLKLKGATAKLTSQIKSVSSWCGLTMPIETFNRVFNMPRYDHANDSLVKAVQEENLNSAENIRQKNNTHADEEEKSKLSIDEVLDFIEREEKQKKKKKSTPTTEYFPSMKEIMKQQWGNESEEYISKLMGDLQGSTKQADPGRIDMLTGKCIRAVLIANISSAIKQYSSYPLAAARVGWKATLAGLKHIRPGKHTPFFNRALPDSYKQSIPYDEIAKYTPILEYRKQGNNSREMAEISRYKGLIDSSGWVGHTLDRLNWIEKNDVLMVEMNYWIAYEHVKGNMGISPDSKEFMPNVAKTLEDIINNMMPNSSVMQQGQILRSKNPVNRIFTICKSQVFCMVNAAMDASGEYNARLKDYKQAVSEFEKKQARAEVKIAKKQLARTYSSIIVSTAMTCGILMPLIAALFGKWDRYRDEDGNITPWSVGSRLLKDFGSELTGMFLFGDTVYNTVLALIDKNEEFYGLSLPGVDTINDFITGIINIARSDTPEKLRKNISSLVGTLGMLTGLPTKNLMNLFQGACNHIENFTKYGGTPTVNDYGEVSMQMYANYCYEALIDGDKKKFAKLYSEWLKEKTSTGKQVDKSYINSKLKTELEDDTEIIAAGNAFFNGDLTAYENTVEKYSDLGFDKTTVVKAINSIVSDLEDEQKNAEGLDKYDNEEESDSKPELYKYSDAFDFLKNGDTESYEKVEKYLMEHKGKTKNQMKKLMQSASRTDPIFEKYIEASKNNDADTTHTLYRQLLNIYGSESKFKSALKKYQGKVKKQQSK